MAQALRPFKAVLLILVAIFLAGAQHAAAQADLVMFKQDSTDPASPGGLLPYTITLVNNGPEDAQDILWNDDLPPGTTFESFSSPPDWTCTTPAVGATGTISCSSPLLAGGGGPAEFNLLVRIDSGVTAGTVITNSAQVVEVTQQDPNPGNESATATTTVADFADYSLSKTDSPDPVVAGTDLVYTLTVNSTGSSPITDVVLTDDPLPAEATFQSLSAPAGWTCSTPAVGDPGGAVVCSIPTMDPGSAVFTLTVRVDASLPGGTVLVNSAFLSSTTPDQNGEDTAAGTETTVIRPAPLSADYSLSKTDSPDPVVAGTDLVYTLNVTNMGSIPITNVVLTDDPLPNEATFQSLSSPAGWTCSTPAVGDPGGSVTCSTASMDPGSAVFTLTVRVGAAVPGGTVLVNSAFLSSTTEDQNPGDTSAGTETTVISPAALFATKSVSGLPAQAGSTVTYIVVLRNTSSNNQGDNPGPEFTDVLPSALTLTGATATAGAVNADLATNTVTWNGGLAAGATATITIQATVSASASAGQTISNQGTVLFDNDGDGVNETTDPTDDPSVAGVDNPTTFVVAADSVVEVPALDTLGFAALALLLATTGALLLRR